MNSDAKRPKGRKEKEGRRPPGTEPEGEKRRAKVVCPLEGKKKEKEPKSRRPLFCKEMRNKGRRRGKRWLGIIRMCIPEKRERQSAGAKSCYLWRRHGKRRGEAWR